jgi:hypothetical protein
MSEPDAKAALFEMAEYWTRLAEHYEKEEGERSQK